MMQNSNLRPDGSTAIQCDAGTPIMGRTSTTGTYQILKVNADGSIAGLPSPIADASIYYSLTPNVTPSPVGAMAGGTAILYADLITTSINAGSYTLSPMYQVQATTTGGAITMILVKVGSTFDAYCSSLNLGSDAFTPNTGNLGTGFAQIWHNIPLQEMGTIAGVSTSTANANVLEKSTYLESGAYKLMVICHTAFTIGSPAVLVSVNFANNG
jgi:hypothetical protein